MNINQEDLDCRQDVGYHEAEIEYGECINRKIDLMEAQHEQTRIKKE